MVAVVSIHILAFAEKETTKEVEEGMVMAKLEREPYHICSQCGFGDVFNYDVRSLEGSLQGSWAPRGKTSAMLTAIRSIYVTMFIDAAALNTCS